MSDFVFKIDHYFAKLFHNIYVCGGDVANWFMEAISWIAEAGILFLLVGIGLALFKRTRKIGGVVLLSVALGFLLTNIVLKNIIERARPFSDINSDFYKWWLDADAHYESGYSFPSGHTTATTAFAVAIFLTCNKKYSTYILLLPLLMASSRIYLMVHYFSDCVGAFVVGSVCAVGAYLIVNAIYKSKAKFFVWVKEFDIFHPKSINTIAQENPNLVKQPVEIKIAQAPAEDYMYITQAEEQKQTTETKSNNAESKPANSKQKNTDTTKK